MSVVPPAPRRAGKRGLNKIVQVPELRLSNFKGGVHKVTPPPDSADVSGGLTSWGMLGNDTYGDCGSAGFYHGLMAKALMANNTATDYLQAAWEPGFTVPTDSIVEATYFAYGRAQGEPGEQPDEGVDNATWFAFLKQLGIVELAAQIDPHNRAEFKQAMIDFKGVEIGVALTDDAEQAFETGQPWDVSPSSQPNPQEGHDILVVKYDPQSLTVVTWGGLQECTIAWEDAEIDQYMDAWVFFTKEDGARAGVDVDALEAEMNSWIQSSPFPQKSGSWFREAEEWLKREFKKAEDEIEHLV